MPGHLAFVDSFLQLEASLAFELLSVHESPDLCAAVGRYELTFRPPGEERQTDAGKFVEIWPFQSRGGMLIGTDDTVYVSEVATATISVVKDGKLIDSITGLGRPHGITMDIDGSFYTADATNRAVIKITPKR